MERGEGIRGSVYITIQQKRIYKHTSVEDVKSLVT